MTLWLGCAIWSFAGWVGDFFPPKSKPGDFLSLYGQRLTAVEGNTTFYAVPSQETAARWHQETPERFRFCLKLHRDLTHHGSLASTADGVRRFLDQVRPLGDKRGPIFAQLPPTFAPGQWRELASFLRAWPYADARLALEVRHPGWFQPRPAERLAELLEDLGVGRVLLDSRPIYEQGPLPEGVECRKPRLPLVPVRTAPFTLVRLVGHPDPAKTEPYLHEWAERLDGWLREETEVFFFMHCPVEERTPAYARRLQELLETRGAPVERLPWASVREIKQLSLL